MLHFLMYQTEAGLRATLDSGESCHIPLDIQQRVRILVDENLSDRSTEPALAVLCHLMKSDPQFGSDFDSILTKIVQLAYEAGQESVLSMRAAQLPKTVLSSGSVEKEVAIQVFPS